ncbi:MAG: hypothetical protein JSV08_00630 [Acidobacteriota bacterium]|nr:MAG: hypothetical protein JSV08_00630 [Acidobacteriota bacterium]
MMNKQSKVTPIKCFVLGFFVSLVAPLFVSVFGAVKHDEMVYGEPKDDMALVYFIRSGHFTGSARTLFLYADDTFLGTLDNKSYSFAYVEPGNHLFWTNWTRISKEMELVAGVTYYLDVWMKISIVDKVQGKALISQQGRYVTPTDREMATSARHIEKRYGRAQKRDAKKEKAEIETVATVKKPDDTEGMVKIPGATKIRLELLENVSSYYNETGGTVWFKVAKDHAVGGRPYLRKGLRFSGTIRQAQRAKAYGAGGEVDVVIPAIYTPEGGVLPLVAQIATAGDDETDTATAVVAAGGAIAGAFVKGKESYHLVGEILEVRVREDAWVPEAATSEESDDESSDGTAPETLEASVQSPVTFKPQGRRTLKDIQIEITAADGLGEVEVYAVGDLELPEPVKPIELDRSNGTTSCVFNGWSLIRYMRTDAENAEVLVKVRGNLKNGVHFVSEAAVTFSVDHGK